jgi:hypothetical protein
VSKTSENVTARLLYVPAGTDTAAERSAESLCKRVNSTTKLLAVPETNLTLTALPEEGVSETPVTVARNVRMERFAEGEGGVARRVSESVALPVPAPPPPPGFEAPLHAQMPSTTRQTTKPQGIRFIVHPKDQICAPLVHSQGRLLTNPVGALARYVEPQDVNRPFVQAC